jgi:hypothetical protein
VHWHGSSSLNNFKISAVRTGFLLSFLLIRDV